MTRGSPLDGEDARRSWDLCSEWARRPFFRARAADESSGTSPVSAPDAAPSSARGVRHGHVLRLHELVPHARELPPPWEYVEDDADAFAKLERALRGRAVLDSVRADAAAGFLAASLAYPDGIDEYEFYFKNDGSKTVLFKAQSRVNRASPPGCSPRVASTAPQRARGVEELRREIGWLGFETDEDKNGSRCCCTEAGGGGLCVVHHAAAKS